MKSPSDEYFKFVCRKNKKNGEIVTKVVIYLNLRLQNLNRFVTAIVSVKPFEQGSRHLDELNTIPLKVIREVKSLDLVA
jgi:hypothetical protein